MSTAELMDTSQYLTYKLDQETFALDITKVREVLDFTSVTKVPRTPDFIRGVINLRGSVVPVVDLKLKFGMPRTVKSVGTCIIISEVNADGESAILGCLADSVQEVMDLDADHIAAPPKIGTSLKTEFIKGMGRQGDQFIIILDIDKVFSNVEIRSVREVQTEA